MCWIIEGKKEFEINKSTIYKKIKKDAVFIHPTDTIYGIGCDATNPEAVKKLRAIKFRYKRPFLVIAPSLRWVKENCEITKEAEKYMKKWPGPVTLILKLKNRKCVAEETNYGLNTLGIRMIDHWFNDVAKELDVPIITTSANRIGEDFMTSLETLDPTIKSKLDFILYEGEKKGHPSTLIDLTQEKVEIKERKK